MPPRVRIILVSLLLGLLTVGASVLFIVYWPRQSMPYEFRLDRDRDPSAGEGRGFVSLWYTTGVGYQQAVGHASQQFLTGGYNYATNTETMPWPSSMSSLAAPWIGIGGSAPWPPDGESQHTFVLRVGWPAPMLQGERSQTVRRPRRGGVPGLPSLDDDPGSATNIITVRNWIEANQLWSPYGGWAYTNAPGWLKSSRLGVMVFNKRNLAAVPTRPLWFGVLVNIVLFSAAWWCTITLVRRVRRAVMTARTAGRCAWCRYPRVGLGPDAPCPECGKRPGRDSNPRPAV